MKRLLKLLAFSLVICVLLFFLLTPLITSNLQSQVESAKLTRTEGDILMIMTDLMLYEARNKSVPTTEQGLKALSEKPTIEPIPKIWKQITDEVPKDPWGQEYKYRFPAQKSKKPYDVWSSGKDLTDGTEDDIGNWPQTATK